MSIQSEFEDFTVLVRRWNEARAGRRVPRYEDVGVGNLGNIASDLAVFETTPTLRAIRCGDGFGRLTGLSEVGVDFSTMQSNYRDVIMSGVLQTIVSSEPVLELVPCIVDGCAGTSEVLLLPLDWKSMPLVIAVCRMRIRSQNLLDAIYRSTRDGMLILTKVYSLDGTRDYQIMTANAAACRYLGADEAEIQWGHLSTFVAGSEFTGFLHHLAELRASGDTTSFELDHMNRDGSRHYLKVSGIVIDDLISISFADITSIKQREAAVRVLFDNNPIPNIVYYPKTLQILSVNEAAVQKYGIEHNEFLRRNLLSLCQSEDNERMGRHLQNNHRDMHCIEMQHVTADGKNLDVVCHSRAIRINGVRSILVSIMDVTDQRRAEAKIMHMAHHDHLTSLANRVLFRAKLEQALQTLVDGPQKLAVHLIDLDNFKHVNDSFGHPFGDGVLALVAKRLRQNVTGSDLVARLGGDEFAVIQFEISDRGDADHLAGKLVRELSAPYDIDGQEVRIGASIGVSVAPEDCSEPDQLIKHADIAMYRAKIDGKSTYRFFEQDMDVQLQLRRAMEADIRIGLEEQQFEMYFQPLLQISDRSVIGCEALMRWNHPVRGLVSPVEFIPVAENAGLIIQLGAWALEAACQEASQWPENTKVAVNLSPLQFRGRAVISAVENALAKSGLPARRLELEITESVLFADSDTNREILDELRSLGISISMDDFGTGYSSLSYLRSFAFDKIKIDRSFVSDILVNADCLAIVRSIAMLGQSLGIPILVEGVETREQLEQLGKEGCQQVQGYFFSPPRPAAEIRALMAGAGSTALPTAA